MNDVSIVLGLLSSLVAFVGSLVIKWRVEGATRVFVARYKDGTEESLAVASRADEQDLGSMLERVASLEDDVKRALGRMGAGSSTVQIEQGRYVDFVTTIGDTKFAIEAKESVNFLSMSELRQYLQDAPGVEVLILVSRDQASPRLQARVADTFEPGRIRFVQVDPSDNPDAKLLAAMSGPAEWRNDKRPIEPG